MVGAPRETHLFEFERARIELIVLALLRDKLFVIAALDDDAVFEHHDRMAVAHGGKAVRDDEYRPALHQLIHALFDERFRMRIDGAGRLVEDEHGAERFAPSAVSMV